MTLTLFGPDRPWRRLVDDQPILSGRHPLHLYHGYLGARSLYERGTLCCYDPNFQAGYPKTPVFDSGSRPAELFLILAGGSYRPAAYKIGLAVFCALVPLLLLLAARGAGLGRGASGLAVALGLLVWWGAPCQSVLADGDLDLLLAALAALAQAGLLVRFDQTPSVGGWLGLVLTGGLGWFAQPLFVALLLPLFLAYYFSVGGRHSLVWHFALLAGQAGAVAGNAFWLSDWIGYWWIRAPLAHEARLLPHRTLQTLWEAPFWGGPADRALAVALIALAAAGAWLFNHRRQRQAARLLGLGLAGLLFLAVAGAAWEPLGRFGTSRLLPAALLFAAPPAAYALVEGSRGLCRLSGGLGRGVLLAAGLLLTAGLAASEYVITYAARCTRASPLAVGLEPEHEALVAALHEHTTPEARILWEDDPAACRPGRWTPLLPLLTDRAYLGGLDPRAGIEHAQATLTDELLAGRPIGDWGDGELEDFCRRYNIGWVVCWSAAAQKRFRAWAGARLTTALGGDPPRQLFTVERPRSFALRGSTARWLHADCQHIALGDVVPNADGEAVLSLHYQAGMRVSPSRVRLERYLDPYDPIPFVRLRLPGPVVRVTLTWEK
ncbi:MAG TPA: hypothetical protein VNK04_14535 [Gemmataceae bacterium]|nr:hypothetical protein [Gemmataceae bacterium]